MLIDDDFKVVGLVTLGATTSMATTKTTSQYRRATQYSTGIGESLDKIAGKDVLLHSFTIGQRTMEGELTDFVDMNISTVDDAENIQLFHAWSGSLGQRLNEIPPEAFAEGPLLVTFIQAKTRGGFKVWTIE